MSRVRELEGGEEILPDSFQPYHFIGVAIKEDLGSLVLKGRVDPEEGRWRDKQTNSDSQNQTEGWAGYQPILGLSQQNRDVSACFLNVRPGLP